MARQETRITRRHSRLRIEGTPILSVILGSLTTALPIIAQWPMMPPFGLMLLLGWRLLRTEIWQVWIGVPLGLFDDLASGQPLGSAAFLWTAALLTIEAVNTRLIWRDLWHNWLIASLCITAVLIGSWAFAGLIGTRSNILLILPQIGWSLLFYPFIMRMCAMMDRWRLP